MRKLCAILLAGLLAGCTLPSARPFVSPATFDSPLPPPAYSYLVPLAFSAPELLGPAMLPSKRGLSLACGYDDMARMAREVFVLRVAWLWNWSPDPPLFPGVESVPCVWDGTVIGKALGGNSAWLLGFNEPDQWDQANMTPEEGARLWAMLERTYPDRKLASPQVVKPYDYWLERWYAEYVRLYGRAPRMDAIAIHTYWGKDASEYKRQVAYYIDLAQQWGVPEVWVTEFTLAPELDGTVRTTVAELQAYILWLDAQPMVTRYAPWTNRVECMGFAPNTFFDTPLWGAGGGLSWMGEMYKTLGE